MTWRATPVLKKSPKRYPPGPMTRVFTGDAMGVAKAVEAAMATAMRKGSGACPASTATLSATGARRTAVAVLDMTWLSTEVATKRTASTTWGGVPPSRTPPTADTASASPPVFSSAVAMGSTPAMRTTLCQFTARYASSPRTHPVSAMRAAARTTATACGTRSRVRSAIMKRTIPPAMGARRRGGWASASGGDATTTRSRRSEDRLRIRCHGPFTRRVSPNRRRSSRGGSATGCPTRSAPSAVTR